MIVFHKVLVKNVLIFETAEYSFKNNIVVVRGKNLRSADKTETNGAGKSLFFDMIPAVLYMKTTVGRKPQEFMETGSSISIEFTCFERHYTVCLTKQRSLKYIIHIDSVDQNVHTLAEAQKILQDVWTIPEAEYSSIWYLNSLVYPFILRGTSVQRLAFFTDFFCLKDYDKMRAYFRNMYRKIEDEELCLSVYNTEYESAVTELEGLSLDTSVVTVYEELLASYHKYSEKYAKVKACLGIYCTWERLKSLKTGAEGDVDSLTLLYDKLKKNQKVEKIYKESVDKIEDLCHSIKECTDVQKTLSVSGHDLTELYVKQRNLSREISAKETEIYQGNISNKKIDALESIAVKCSEDSYDKLVAEIATLKAHIEMSKIDRDKCPTCGTVLDTVTIKKNATVAYKQLPEKYNQLNAFHAYVDRQSLSRVDVKKLEAEKNKMGTCLDKLVADIEATTQYNSITKSLATLLASKNELEQQLVVPRKYKNKLEDIEDLLNSLKQDKKISAEMETVANQFFEECGKYPDEIDKENMERSASNLSAKKEVLSKQVEQAAVKKREYDVAVAQKEIFTKKCGDLSTKIERCKEVLKDKDVVAALLKAFSSKGLKMLKISRISNILVQNLNKYRHLLFSEPFKFGIQCDETCFDISVDRGSGKFADIRGFSKSEGNRFNMLLMLSLLPLSSNKLNVCIMDEMDSGFSDTNKVLFREKFLPQLHKIIPNIVVITPDNEKYVDSVDLVVTKNKNGTSSLKEMS